jgi:hypothetical protein
MRRQVNGAKGPRLRLRAVGTAYVHYALAQPGLFRAAFTSHPATAPTDSEVEPRLDGAEPFDVLGQVLDEAQTAGLISARRRRGAEIPAWSAVHGLAGLLLDGPLPVTAADVEFALDLVLDTIERGLLNDA